jgi:hypothetical protein
LERFSVQLSFLSKLLFPVASCYLKDEMVPLAAKPESFAGTLPQISDASDEGPVRCKRFGTTGLLIFYRKRKTDFSVVRLNLPLKSMVNSKLSRLPDLSLCHAEHAADAVEYTAKSADLSKISGHSKIYRPMKVFRKHQVEGGECGEGQDGNMFRKSESLESAADRTPVPLDDSFAASWV